MEKKQFDKIYPIIELLLQETGHRGYINGCFEFTPKWYHRKNEYVFGITMKYEKGNLRLEDYTCAMFSDADDNEVDDSDFEKMVDDIRNFYWQVSELNKDAITKSE